jgi:hypothetical protein
VNANAGRGARESVFREANDRIRDAAEKQGYVGLVPFICECRDKRCTEIIRLALADYELVRSTATYSVVAPGHADESAARTVSDREGYQVVETGDTRDASE